MIHVDTKTGRGHSIGLGCLVFVIALLWSGACGADVRNPSFETTYTILPDRVLPSNWLRLDHPSFSSNCSSLWWTDGTKSVCLYNLIGTPILADDSQSLYQYVDLTGLNTAMFDVLLVSDPPGQFAHFEASLLVDGVPLWSEVLEGEYLDQRVRLPELTDYHMVEIRITALDDGPFDVQYGVFWDNISIFAGPTTIEALVDLDPNPLNLRGCGRWVTGYIELEDGYDAALIDGSTVVLGDIPAYLGRECWAKAEGNAANLIDIDGDGVLERLVRFERRAVEEIVAPPEATLTIQGLLLDGTAFEGTAVIQVVDKAWRPYRHMCRPIRPVYRWCHWRPMPHRWGR